VVICGYSVFMTKNPTTQITATYELAVVEFQAAYDAYYANPTTDKLNAMRTAAAALETVIELAAANGIEVK